MSFHLRIKYFLMHTLMLSNNTADELIHKGWIEIDGVTVYDNCMLPPEAEVKVNGKIEREKKELIYLKFNKPRGYESSMSEDVENNLQPFFEGLEGLAIAGRLDKDSQGLMLLSNDGKWVEYICNPKSFKEKEYIVTLDKDPDENFVNTVKVGGIQIGKHKTLPCECERIGEKTVRIILTEGKNRQIRRVCSKLGANVLTLKRTRIAEFELGALEEGHMAFILKTQS